MPKISFTLLTAAFASSSAHAQTLFSENFDDGNAAARWTAYYGAASGPNDYTANYSFNYIAAGLPLAPSGGSGVGAFLNVNKDATGIASGVTIYPNSQTFSGNYSLKFDFYMQYTPPNGSSEFFGAGINTLGSGALGQQFTPISSSGLMFTISGDGGFTADYRVLVGVNNSAFTQQSFAASGFVSGITGADLPNLGGTYLTQTVFPTSLGYGSPGTPGNTNNTPSPVWSTFEIRQQDGVQSWFLNGNAIANQTNSTWTSGNIAISYYDPNTSIGTNGNTTAAGNFAVIDNIRVDAVPEPGTVALGAVGAVALGIALRKKRS